LADIGGTLHSEKLTEKLTLITTIMTQVQKLVQAAGLINQAMQVYADALAELEQKTGKEYNIIQTHVEVKADELLDYFSRAIGQCTLNDL
jgi:hypothetical protein